MNVEQEPQKEILIVMHNHFDPIWRRCWDMTFEYRGKHYRSYADLEEYIFRQWLAQAENFGAVVSEGQAAVWRKFLERNPDRLDDLKRLHREGRIELTVGGEAVPDTNMPQGETLVRNYLYGLLWYEEVFGENSWVPVCTLEDSFGSSAQLPQILRGFDIQFLTNLSYRFVKGDYWRGLDGSVVCIKRDFPRRGVGSNYKNPPCPSCDGKGCSECCETGLYLKERISADSISETIGGADTGSLGWCLLSVGGEEHLPCQNLGQALESAREEFKDRKVVFAGYGEVLKRLKPWVEKVDDEVQCSDEVEGNPTSSGCLVTRIRLKQRFRHLENLLLSTEKLWALLYARGREYPASELTDAWRKLCFVSFHDALTGTHINSAYRELMDMLDTIGQDTGKLAGKAMAELGGEVGLCDKGNDKMLLVFNPLNWDREGVLEIEFPAKGLEVGDRWGLSTHDGQPVPVIQKSLCEERKTIRATLLSPAIPALGYQAFRLVNRCECKIEGVVWGDGHIENEYLRVEWDDRGIRRILDKEQACTILGERVHYINELLLEEDVGDMWSTMKAPSFRIGLSSWTRTIDVVEQNGTVTLRLQGEYTGPDQGVKTLRWNQDVLLAPASRTLEFSTSVEWDTSHRRLMVSFPTTSSEEEAYYEVPYGHVKRDRYNGSFDHHNGANGDWPSLRWVQSFDEDKEYGISVINRGTSGCHVEEGVILMSLVRSPASAAGCSSNGLTMTKYPCSFIRTVAPMPSKSPVMSWREMAAACGSMSVVFGSFSVRMTPRMAPYVISLSTGI